MRSVRPAACMPRLEDYAHTWWAEGFPSHTPKAPWLRCIQTGCYAMALDTETLRIPHFGPVASGLDYAACAVAGNVAWQSLPPADLALTITADGKEYRCTGGGKWTQHGGPRLIESGRFMQRADVTGLVFTAADGARLNVEARLETVAWPDRLALLLAARPGRLPIPAGETCFGWLGGGFGLDGANHLEIPHAPELDPEQFTLELWAFVPTNCQVSRRAHPWLVCKNGNEWKEGNYGIVLIEGRPRFHLNIGGGRENAFFVDAQGHRPLHTEKWNHLAMSYDGDTLRVHV
ncbi:MAG: LamG domain-containing protein, partial [Planctomycetes bacterium]|nr:LamG domain-containing protein [Planctomycetota bacterium]